MTWQHLLRTLVVVGFAAFALAFATRAHAETGDSSVYSNLDPVVEEPLRVEQGVDDENVATGRATATEAELGPNTRRAARPRPVSTPDMKALIARHASENGVPFELADAVVRLESKYNAAARNGPHVGLTQIHAGTAFALGYRGATAGLLDPDTNLRYGLKYLAQAYKLAGGDTCGTILRFQSGHRAQRMTRSASAYCDKIQTILADAG
jgi:soluble lytic murein transglycosylase-like protein